MLYSQEVQKSNGRSTHITKEQQEEWLTRAKEAAASGEAGKMLEFLHRSFIIDGLTRQVALKWRSLSASCSKRRSELIYAVNYGHYTFSQRRAIPELFCA
jgi:hypothetical protein